MLRNKKFLIIFVLILLIILIAVYFYLKSIKQNQVQPTGLTQEERTSILNELNNSNIKPITGTERKQVLKDLNSGGVNPSLSEVDRTAIINSLNSGQ